MNYSEEFKKSVKAAYPDSTEMHKLLEQGNELLGRYLDDSVNGGGISADRVVKLLEAGQSQTLLTEARNLVARRDVYAQWSQLYTQQHNWG